jgi:hypothetical protein
MFTAIYHRRQARPFRGLYRTTAWASSRANNLAAPRLAPTNPIMTDTRYSFEKSRNKAAIDLLKFVTTIPEVGKRAMNPADEMAAKIGPTDQQLHNILENLQRAGP